MPQFKFGDDLWVQTKPTEDLGGIGLRELAEYTDAIDRRQATRKLLLRRPDWRYPGFPAEETPPKLVRRPAPPTLTQVVVPMVGPKSREEMLGGKEVPSDVFEQDLTRHLSFAEAIESALTTDETDGQLRELLTEACTVLEGYRTATQGPGGKLMLQCPQSLACRRANNRWAVQLLDAELWPDRQIPPTAAPSEFFHRWFDIRSVQCTPPEYDGLHGRALLRFARSRVEALAQAGKLPASRRNALVSWLQKLERYNEATLKGLRERIAGKVDPAPPPPVEQPPPPRAAWPKWSLAANAVLLLALLGVVAYGQWRGKRATPADELSPYRPAEWYVIFPSPGSPDDKVKNVLREVFNGNYLEVSGDKSRSDARDNEVKRALAALEADAPGLLLARLYSKQVRFKGFDPQAPAKLDGVIRNGGVYEYPADGQADATKSPAAPAHRSILQPGVFAHLKGFDNSLGEPERKQLGALRDAVASYAALDDALNSLGGRKAFLVPGHPEPEKFEKAHRDLLGRTGKPLFVFRPNLAFYDAIDPAGPTGSGDPGSNVLRLSRNCWFRQVGEDERKGVSWADVNQAERQPFLWAAFRAGEEIRWSPVQLPRGGGMAPLTATSFDIAVPVDDEKQFAVFRNQFIHFGKTEAEVSRSADAYLRMRLGLAAGMLSGAYSPVSRNGGVSATLSYVTLADRVKDNAPASAPDVKLLSADEFGKLRQSENNEVK